MSYCRWSTDSFRCDLYCYEDVGGGYMTHVAARRIDDGAPREDWGLMVSDPDEFMRQHVALLEWMETHPLRPIGLDYDGLTFHDPTPGEFLDRLMMLRRAGYRFPDDVLLTVAEEMAAGRGVNGAETGTPS